VEVALPHDASDHYNFSWLTRYNYDLSQGGTVAISGASGITAHGNLYKTQEWLPSPACSGWTDQKGTAYDALDRATTQYAYVQTGGGAVSCGDSLQRTTLTYDASSATYGLLASKTDSLNEVATYAYDADARATSIQYSGDGGVTPAQTTTYDPDARVATRQSSAFTGQQSYSYNNDGLLTQSAEPSGIPAATTLTYGYYPNGWRSSISIGSSAINQTNAIQYAYRVDGLKSMASATYGSTLAKVTWTYSNAGRMQSMANNSGAAARQITYDGFDRTSSDSGGPGAPYSGFQYDDEGEVTGYTGFGTQVTQAYTVRGELQHQTFANFTSTGCTGAPQTGLNWSGLVQNNAEGYSIQSTNAASCSWNTDAFDPLTGVTEQTASPSSTMTYTYDAGGRESQATNDYSGTMPCGDTTCDVSGSGNFTKQYDAQNHLIGQTYTTWQTYGGGINCPANWSYNAKNWRTVSIGLSYKWGPNGHVAEAGNNSTGTMQYETVHWDGDSVLFTTNSSGAIDDLKLGVDADITVSNGTPSAVFVSRDFAGATGDPPSANRQLCGSGPGVIWEPGPDGISDGYNVFQGVRTYDPMTGTWSTPDAYEGLMNDPMSQHAYMWNRNNSEVYSDPSGYDTLIDYQPGAVYGAGHVQLVIYDPRTGGGILMSLQSSTGAPWGATAQVVIKAVNVKDLPAAGNVYFHLATNRSQELKMLNVYLKHQQQAAQKGEKYDLADNNCADTAEHALDSAGIPGRLFLPFLEPNMDLLWDENILDIVDSKPQDLVNGATAGLNSVINGDRPTWSQQLSADDPILGHAY
jgi:hypothetical protein